MSDKKISIIIIILAFGAGIGYLLFGWGAVEIFVGNENVSQFELQMVEEKKLCDNPCEIKLRPGKRLRAKLILKGFRLEPIISSKSALFSREKISLLLSPLSQIKRIPIEGFLKQEAVQTEPFKKYEESALGPVRVNPEGSLATFLRPLGEGKTALILVNKAGKEQRLTIFQDTFSPSILEKNFQFFHHGILIPTTQKLYSYDFVTNSKKVLFVGETLYFASVSQNNKGDLVTKTEKGWEVLSSDGEARWLGDSVEWAQFSSDSLWIVDGKQIKRDQLVVAELPEKVGEKDVIYFDFSDNVNTLWIRRDLEVWRVDL